MLTSRLLSYLCPLTLLLAGCSTREPRAVDANTKGIAPVVTSNNELAWKLYGAARKTDGNIFFSPFSISAAFGMTLAGASGDTATEIQNVLSIPTGGENMYHQDMGALLRDLGGAHPGRSYELDTADRLFGQNGMPFQPAFTSLVASDYGAPLSTVDYANPAAAVDRINQWVSGQTNGKIPTLVNTDLVNQDTRLVLANAIYFKASWARQFDPKATQSGAFHLANGTDVSVPMMHATRVDARVASNQDVRMIDLDYRDNELSMVVLMPSDASSLPTIEQELTRPFVEDLITSEQPMTFDEVAMPRWELGLDLPLKDILMGLGMKNAFDPLRADFSKVLDPKQGALYLGFAVHKAYIRVDEEGTVAAAATAGGEQATAFLGFEVNRPFVYLIRDRLTGSILFVGRMSDPTNHGTL